ncbi:glycosyltransferase family 2 protein [Paenibacillus alkaliterrae]|uniref:glycosyltransferase family 2 protein n=1 Tax=Paenibacillus alkaliterrae TaxID=320909 RepID=UPI001F39116B|nr:glycosyltransferase family 2 protein [Paenibacillus alkaliterrae]MCF2939761.1 glycosyltransferase family 2 protein [Paenibacillus alkaliterrae]
MAKISVIINTLNEEQNIGNCLECVKWADEIIVVDMYSNDKTVEIVREYTDKVYFHERMGYADPARQFALNQANNEWILVVDADELVPKEMRNRIIEIADSGKWDAVLLPHLNYFFGHKMEASGCGPLQNMHIRFFKKSVMQYSDRIHNFAHVTPSARIYYLKDTSCSFIHFSYLDVEHFLEKVNRYTTIEANNAKKSGETFSLLRTIWRGFKEVVYFFVKKGYKDGLYGFALSIFMLSYRISVGLKLYLLEKYQTENPRSAIIENYQSIADYFIQEYRNEKT